MSKCFQKVDVDRMAMFQTYRGNKQGTLFFTVVPPGHIEQELVKPSVVILDVAERKRKYEESLMRQAYCENLRDRMEDTRKHNKARKQGDNKKK